MNSMVDEMIRQNLLGPLPDQLMPIRPIREGADRGRPLRFDVPSRKLAKAKRKRVKAARRMTRARRKH